MLLQPSTAAVGRFSGKIAPGIAPLRMIKLRASNRERELDVSVLRFTLGIPGFDDSKLPRILGLAFGSLIVANHVFSPQIVSPAQLRSEGLGVFLAVVAALLPSLGKLDEQFSGARTSTSDLNQVFAMAECLSDIQKQELAWVSYALIRNTKTIAVLVWRGDKVVLARGCWNLPKDDHANREQDPLPVLQPILHAFIETKETLYLSTRAGDSGPTFMPQALESLVAQPFTSKDGGIIVASDVPRAYNLKDRNWIQCLVDKVSSVL